MDTSRRRRRQSGFTLVEILIVITVIGILALLVIPRIMGASRRARESVMSENLHDLRLAIGHFEADTGLYPEKLEDLVVETSPAKGYDDTGTLKDIPPGLFHGPYFYHPGGIVGSGLPANPFLGLGVSETEKHWTYLTTTPNVGTVKSAVSGYTWNGISYADL